MNAEIPTSACRPPARPPGLPFPLSLPPSTKTVVPSIDILRRGEGRGPLDREYVSESRSSKEGEVRTRAQPVDLG